MSDGQTPAKGDQFRFPDGTHEVVFHVAEGRVLTVREYPTVDSYLTAVADGEYRGTHEGVTNLPDPSAFADGAGESEE